VSDNTRLNKASSNDGDWYASDDIDGIKYSRVKLIHGNDGINDGDVSASNPLPVSVGNTSTITLRTAITATQTNAALVTQAPGGQLVITEVSVAAANANTEDCSVRIGLGASTTPTGAGVVFAHPGMASGFYCSRGNGAGLLGVGADGEDLRITTSTISGTVALDVVVSYYVL
jgi:hypothetical protein